MRTQHLLLWSSIALSSPALAAESRSAADVDAKPPGEAVSRTDAARKAQADDETMKNAPARKNRVRQTYPPAAKHL
jgi:hypothetical protein